MAAPPVSGEALLDALAQPVGGAEEQKALQAEEQDRVAVVAQHLEPLVGRVGAGLVVAAGERVADDVDAAVFDREQDGGGDQPDEDAPGEADEGDDGEDEDDHGVFGAAPGGHSDRTSHWRISPPPIHISTPPSSGVGTSDDNLRAEGDRGRAAGGHGRRRRSAFASAQSRGRQDACSDRLW